MTLKEWCLETAQKYRRFPDNCHMGICTRIEEYVYVCFTNGDKCDIDFDPLREAIRELPDHNYIGHKWPCGDGLPRAEFLEDFVETL